MNRPFWATKTFWTAVAGTLTLATTCYAFAIDANPIVKASFAFATGLCAILEAAFVASRVTTEATETRSVIVTGVGTDGSAPATESNPDPKPGVGNVLPSTPAGYIGPRPF